ncbi:hypothetical protein [Halobacillus faecis]|uniref:hypothetical protein n=1 Tax=Halobacillus faecis TaxID=360184 RepID=UPI003530FC13
MYLKQTKFLFFSIIFAIVLFAFFNDVIHKAINTVLTLNNEIGGGRGKLTASAFEITTKNPLGVGPGNIEAYMPDTGWKIHNFWLEISSNYGLLVFFGLIFLFIHSLVLLIKNRNNQLNEVLWPILWCTILFIPASTVPSSIFHFNLLWFFLGVLIAATQLIYKNTNHQK